MYDQKEYIINSDESLDEYKKLVEATATKKIVIHGYSLQYAFIFLIVC